MDYDIKKMTCKSALHYHNSKWLPYKYDINVYRGCAHRCVYCYALYSHDYIGGGSFYNNIFAKTNVADVLKRELPTFSRETVNLGGITDSYQPAERENKLMPDVLRLLAKYSVPATLSTKSTLILRDLDLLKKVDEKSALNTAFTVTTMDKTIAKLIEPNAPDPRARMNAVEELGKQGIKCGVHLMPIIPFLTSGQNSLEEVFRAAKNARADYILASALNLKGNTKKGFFDSILQSFPSQFSKIKEIYQNRSAYSEYKNNLNAVLDKLRKEYDIPYYPRLSDKKENEQLSFL